MAVLVNFKICDNAKECGGVAVCPTGAFTYDEDKETIVIDNSKCISCGLCENECPIGAIMVARTDEEYQNIEAEIDNDPRTTKDLFVDRYGAAPLSEFFMIEKHDLKEKINNNCITLIEFYNEETLECLLKSIPIKELTQDLPSNTLFYKIAADDELKNEYNLKELPALLIFNKNELIGKIEGYWTVDEKEELISKIHDFCKDKV